MGNDIRISTKLNESDEWKQIGTAKETDTQPERGIYISSNPDNTPENHWMNDFAGLVDDVQQRLMAEELDEELLSFVIDGKEYSMEMTGGVDWGTEGGDKTVIVSGPRKANSHEDLIGSLPALSVKRSEETRAPRNRAERRKQQRDEARLRTQKKRR